MIFGCLYFYSAAQAQYPDSFLNVHCEPHNAHLFPRLIEMVALADSFGIPLNIQFTPQWGQEILADPVKLDKVRQWQRSGHEIGAHHHGIEAGNGWDGYTDHPPELWPHADRYMGTMADFMDILNQLAGDSLILNGGFGDTDDWPQGVPVRTWGNTVAHAISRPEYEKNNGQDCYAITYCVSYREDRVDSLMIMYQTAGAGDIFGFNNHVFNFDFNQSYLRKWMKFIAGKNNRNVRQIMRERGLLTPAGSRTNASAVPAGFRLYPVFPNPFNHSTRIRYSVPVKTRTRMTVWDASGRQIQVLVNGPEDPGEHEILWNAEGLPSGLYLIRLGSGNADQVTKCLLIQ
ncbi:T9SS type A sorting domain-containing protein [bacterium]|nr:T9SS type A sorting domain-containing protein [bacterium]